MPIGDSMTRLLARKTKWLRLAPLIALGAIAAMLLVACNNDEPTQTPESNESQPSPGPTLEIVAPTPSPAPTIAPTPKPTVTPTHTPAPLVTPSPTAVPTWDDYGSEALEQLSCETWDGVRDATAIVPAELYPIHRLYHTASLLDNGHIVMAAGFEGSPYEGGIFPLSTTTVDVYSPETGSWCSVITGDKYAYLTDPVTLADGSILLFGVKQATNLPDQLERVALRFDAATRVVTEVELPTVSRRNPKLALLDDGRILVAGGWNRREDGELGETFSFTETEIYDPGTNSWSMAAQVSSEPLLSIRTEKTIFTSQWLFPVPGGRAVLATVGDDSEDRDVGRIHIYDATADSWSTLASFTSGYSDASWHVMLAPEGKLVFFYENRAEIYDLETGDWAISYSPHSVPRVPTTTVLPDGRILVSGGATEGGRHSGRFFERPTASTDILDPETLIWAAGPPMEEARHGHSATLLRDGSVLMYGGIGISANTDELVPLNSVEVIGAAVLAAVDTVTPPEANSPWATCIRASNTEPLPSSTREIAEPPYSAAALLDAAVQAVDALTSYAYESADFRYTTQDSLGDRVIKYFNCSHIEWKYRTPDSFEINAHELGGAEVYHQLMTIGIGGDPYVYFSKDSGETWTRSDAGAEELNELLPPHKEILQVGAGEFLTNLQITGVELLNGVDVFHVTGGFTYEGTGTGETISYWIGVDDLLVHRIVITYSPNESDDGDRQHFDEF